MKRVVIPSQHLPKHRSPFQRTEIIQQAILRSPLSPKQELTFDKIRLEECSKTTLLYYKRQMTKASWNALPGRSLCFLVLHGEVLLGIVHLGSPVARLGVRDAFLGLPSVSSTERLAPLRNYLELAVCVGAQPLAWYWNLGKLCALLAATVGDFYEIKYQDALHGVFTTSLWGKGVQYNRVYKFLGYTKGTGTGQIPPEMRKEALIWCRANMTKEEFRRKFAGSGITRSLLYLSEWVRRTGKEELLKHGQQRGVWYHAAIDPSQRQNVIADWYQRWGRPRWDRVRDAVSPYETGFGMSVEL